MLGRRLAVGGQRSDGWRWAALLVAVSCTSSSRPAADSDANRTDAAIPDATAPDARPLSCDEVVRDWRSVVAGTRACSSAEQCVLKGAPGWCDAPAIGCGQAVNAEAYAASEAPALAALYEQEDCGISTTDCSVPLKADCIDYRCEVVDEFCCFCTSTAAGAVVIAQTELSGVMPIQRGTRVAIEFTSLPRSVLPFYDDVVPPGIGCVAYAYSAGESDILLEEGEVTIAGPTRPFPSCRFDADQARYRCVAATAPTSDGDSLTLVSPGVAELHVAEATFSDDMVGMHVDIVGAGEPSIDRQYSVLETLEPTRLRLAAPLLSMDVALPAGGTITIVAGAGPGAASYLLAPDGQPPQLLVSKTAGRHLEAWTDIPLTLAGAGFRLDDDSYRPHAVPLDGRAVAFSCAGTGGDCGESAPLSVVEGRTTTAPVEGLGPTAMPKSSSGTVVTWKCTAFSAPDYATPVGVPQEIMRAVADSQPTRIELRVRSAAVTIVSNEDGRNTTRLEAGHELVGYTTPAAR